MGYHYDPDVLSAEFERQIKELSGFGKAKFLLRFASSIGKVGKSGRR